MPPRRNRRNIEATAPAIAEEEPHPAKRGRKGKKKTTTPAAPTNSDVSSAEQTGVEPLQEFMAQLPALISTAVTEGLRVAGIGILADPPLPEQLDPVEVNATPISGVDGAIRSVVDNITGERDPVDKPTSTFTSISVPLAGRVPEKIKSKIWADEYVDFARLLTTETEGTQYSFKVNGSSGSSPVLSLEPTHKLRPITRVEQWQTAFEVFVAVFTERSPQSAPALMKPDSAVIRELALHSANWKF